MLNQDTAYMLIIQKNGIETKIPTLLPVHSDLANRTAMRIEHINSIIESNKTAVPSDSEFFLYIKSKANTIDNE